MQTKVVGRGRNAGSGWWWQFRITMQLFRAAWTFAGSTLCPVPCTLYRQQQLDALWLPDWSGQPWPSTGFPPRKGLTIGEIKAKWEWLSASFPSRDWLPPAPAPSLLAATVRLALWTWLTCHRASWLDWELRCLAYRVLEIIFEKCLVNVSINGLESWRRKTVQEREREGEWATLCWHSLLYSGSVLVGLGLFLVFF